MYLSHHKTSIAPASSDCLYNLLKDSKKTAVVLLVFHNMIHTISQGLCEKSPQKTD
mgnify:CR=1 FL=1